MRMYHTLYTRGHISIYTHLFISTFYTVYLYSICYTQCRLTRGIYVGISKLLLQCMLCLQLYIWNMNVWMDSMDGWLERMDIQLACRIGTSYYVLCIHMFECVVKVKFYMKEGIYIHNRNGV